MLSIKFMLEKEIRRIDTGEKATISFAELKSTCERLFQGKLGVYILKYFDGEDWITCSSDEELHHAIQLAEESRILKFSIIPNNKRNILDSIEDVIKHIMAKNPAKSLWELIKKEEQLRKARKVKALAAKSNSSLSIEASKENVINEISTPIEEKTQEQPLTTEPEKLPECEFPYEVPNDIEIPEKVDAYPSEFESEIVSTLESSQVSQVTDSITVVSDDCISLPPIPEEIQEEVIPEEEPSAQTRSVPDLSQSQLDPQKLELKLTQLEEMGFSNRDRNATYLIKCNGDMMEAVKSLLEDV